MVNQTKSALDGTDANQLRCTLKFMLALKRTTLNKNLSILYISKAEDYLVLTSQALKVKSVVR